MRLVAVRLIDRLSMGEAGRIRRLSPFPPAVQVALRAACHQRAAAVNTVARVFVRPAGCTSPAAIPRECVGIRVDRRPQVECDGTDEDLAPNTEQRVIWVVADPDCRSPKARIWGRLTFDPPQFGDHLQCSEVASRDIDWFAVLHVEPNAIAHLTRPDIVEEGVAGQSVAQSARTRRSIDDVVAIDLQFRRLSP